MEALHRTRDTSQLNQPYYGKADLTDIIVKENIETVYAPSGLG